MYNYKYKELGVFVDSKVVHEKVKSDDLSKINNWLNNNKWFTLEKNQTYYKNGWFRQIG